MNGEVALLALGAAFGSFAATIATRVAREETVIVGRSRCDKCGAQLSVFELIPMLSFFFQQGRCRHCKSRISPVHLLGEIAGLAMTALSLLLPWPERFMPLGAGAILLVIALIDAKTMRIPNLLVGAVALLGALRLCTLQTTTDVVASLAAALMVFGGLLLLAHAVERRLGRQALGFGDVKLAFTLTLLTSPLLAPWALVTASATGLVWASFTRQTSEPLPFAPFIALGFWTMLLVDGLALRQ